MGCQALYRAAQNLNSGPYASVAKACTHWVISPFSFILLLFLMLGITTFIPQFVISLPIHWQRFGLFEPFKVDVNSDDMSTNNHMFVDIVFSSFEIISRSRIEGSPSNSRLYLLRYL